MLAREQERGGFFFFNRKKTSSKLVYENKDDVIRCTTRSYWFDNYICESQGEETDGYWSGVLFISTR